MASVDATARVEHGAQIGRGAAIGPYCVIGANVVIGEGCRLIAHIHVHAGKSRALMHTSGNADNAAGSGDPGADAAS